MNPWLSDSSLTPNNHVGFGGPMDAGMSFLQPPQTINPAQFQNPAFLNGAGRTASPAFHNPVYQTNPVIPSKRAREDSLGTSPRQAPGGIPGSRSQTPGQAPFPGYNSQPNGAPPMSNAPTPFQHLQATSNATPSPTISQLNQFNQNPGSQRVATASPSPFSPQHVPPHASPAPDHGNRVGTPHDNPQNFMPNGAFPPGFSQPQFAQSMNHGMPQMGMSPQPNMVHQQQGMNNAQRNYQMQLQAQARQMQIQAQAQARMNGTMGGNGPPPGPNPQMPPGPPSAFQPPRPSNPEEFLRGLQTFMAARGRAVELNPTICGRQVQLLRLYAAVVKSGGSQRLTKMNQWAVLAQQFGFQGQQQIQAGQELQAYWLNNLAPYEAAWHHNQQKQRMAAQAAIQTQNQTQMSPTRDAHPPQDPSHSKTPSLNGQVIPPMQQANAHTFAPSVSNHTQQEPPVTPQHRPSISRQFDSQQIGVIQAHAQSQTPQKRPQTAVTKPLEPEIDLNKPLSRPIEDPFKPDILPTSRFHGPVNVDEVFIISQHITELKPVAPTARELGVIDVHALTMAIKSGLHAETRVALDTLVTLSTESSFQLALAECDDLMDALIDCAQDQVTYLADHAQSISDEISLVSYEDLIRQCRLDTEQLQDPPQFGTVLYDLERAADRLICITTLIRNFSFYEPNFGVLGQPEILKLLSTVIRQMGTTESFLRNNRNTLDFVKDVVIYLSNLSTSLELPGKEEALCILHFLLIFAPTPAPTSSANSKVSFTMYTPSLHKYMPSAVDSLAKLLAHDEPNRTYFKAIFAADCQSTPPYELLTRTFGLAISSVPASSPHTRTIIEARKPFLLQGMLAAEILAGLAPSSDHGLARSWLESDDGFAGNLLRLVSLLSAVSVARTSQATPRHAPQPNNRINAEQDANGYSAMSNRAMAVLKILVQKSRTIGENGSIVVPLGVMPKKESLLGAMIQEDIDPGILRQLCVYAGLEE